MSIPHSEPFYLPTFREGVRESHLLHDFKAIINRARSDKPVDIVSPHLVVSKLAQLIALRTANKYDTVILIDGDEGDGKSDLALHLCQAIYPTYQTGSLCYDEIDIVRAYQKTDIGRPILYDEGVRGLLSTDTFKKEQKIVVTTMALVREKRCVLIICAPSIWLVAKQIRNRRVTFWIHVFDRGIARVHERDKKLRYTNDSDSLGLTISPRFPKLTWDKFDDSDPFIQSYSKEKNHRLKGFLSSMENILSKRARHIEGSNNES